MRVTKCVKGHSSQISGENKYTSGIFARAIKFLPQEGLTRTEGKNVTART
jgi:hypothetical protein